MSQIGINLTQALGGDQNLAGVDATSASQTAPWEKNQQPDGPSAQELKKLHNPIQIQIPDDVLGFIEAQCAPLEDEDGPFRKELEKHSLGELFERFEMLVKRVACSVCLMEEYSSHQPVVSLEHAATAVKVVQYCLCSSAHKCFHSQGNNPYAQMQNAIREQLSGLPDGMCQLTRLMDRVLRRRKSERLEVDTFNQALEGLINTKQVFKGKPTGKRSEFISLVPIKAS